MSLWLAHRPPRKIVTRASEVETRARVASFLSEKPNDGLPRLRESASRFPAMATAHEPVIGRLTLFAIEIRSLEDWFQQMNARRSGNPPTALRIRANAHLIHFDA